MVSVYLFFVYYYINEKTPPRTTSILYILPTILVVSFAFTDYSVKEMYFYENRPSAILPGELYLASFFLLLFILFSTAIRLIRHIRHLTGSERVKGHYIAVGFLSVVIGQLVFDLILPILGYIHLYILGPLASIIFAILVAYAIKRHNLMGIKVILQRGFIYTIIFGIIVVAYSIVAITSIEMYTDKESQFSRILVGVMTIIFILVTIPRLDRYLRRLTDPIFFSDTFKYETALHELSSSLSEQVRLDKIVSESEEKLAHILRSEFVKIGKQIPDTTAMTIPVPNEPKTFISIGPKKSGLPYNKTEETLLQTFAYQISVALGRALLFANVTKRANELETRVKERTQQIKDIQESQRNIMLQLSHNLQTPLTILLNNVERLQASIPTSEYRSLQLAIQSVSHYITRLLRLARLESNQEPSVVEHISLSALVDEVVEEVTTIGDAADITLAATVKPNVMVLGDVTHLREAFLNILSNALKYANPTSTITVTLRTSKDAAVFSCRNVGTVISKDDSLHIFTPFYRSPQHSTVTGTGLGLAITKQIVERHNGTISVTSNKTGTKFTIRLPLTALSHK